jgi:lipid-A-disaccharide synthase
MIVAGEASGDRHGARLVSALRDAEPETDFIFFGAAGPKMRDVNVEPIVVADNLSIVGLLEIGRALPTFVRAMRRLNKAATELKPDVVVLIDFPDFNLRLAKSMKKRGFKVVYYISPQLWAWRKYRISAIRKYVDLLLTILPFERDWYSQNNFHRVEFVGNPLSFDVRVNRTRAEFCDAHGLNPAKPIVSLLPGSRQKEIVRILPIMIDTAREIHGAWPEAQFVVAMANGHHLGFVRDQVERILSVVDVNVKIVENETYDALGSSDVAAVTSGTATLECGIIGTPMAIVYKTSALNYRLFKPLISVEHYGLVNLIAGRRLAKEIIQNDLTAQTLSDELERLLVPVENAQMRADLNRVHAKLGRGGASERAALAILKTINSPS